VSSVLWITPNQKAAHGLDRKTLLRMWEESERTTARTMHDMEGRNEEERKFHLYHGRWLEKADADEMIRPAENAGKGNE
jgi:hypothetical protein